MPFARVRPRTSRDGRRGGASTCRGNRRDRSLLRFRKPPCSEAHVRASRSPGESVSEQQEPPPRLWRLFACVPWRPLAERLAISFGKLLEICKSEACYHVTHRFRR